MDTNNLITITTDFGDQFAAAQLKAVAYSLGFKGKIIENHSVTPFSVLEGAFELAELARFCPLGAVHLGVVDPGVGSQRAGIIIQTGKSYFVGPDNGLLYPAAQREKIVKVWKINEGGVSKKFANTFHGRDIFIKAAIYLAQGKTPEEFGCQKIRKLEKLAFKPGQVVHVDHYGNVKVWWKKKLDGHLVVNGQKIPTAKTFSDVPLGKPLAYIGSHGVLELAVNLGNAQNLHHLSVGDDLNIEKV